MTRIPRFTHTILAAAALALAMPGAASARTKLVALPDRDSIILSLEHPSVNLVTEERVLTLQQGVNTVDFSWQGVSIDPQSIQIQMLDHPGEGKDSTKVLNVAYPPNENALTWTLATPEPRSERVRILYLLSGFTQETEYQVTTAKDEKSASVVSNFSLFNQSGEDLASVLIRRGFGETWKRDLRNGDLKKLQAFTNPKMPVSKLYITRPDPNSQRGDEGEIVNFVYEIKNTPEFGFGKYRLPGGKARIFQTDSQGTVIFNGEDLIEAAPVGEKRLLSLGQAKDVTIKRRIMNRELQNIRRNKYDQNVLWDTEVTLKFELQNFKKEPVTLRIVESMSDEWEVKSLDSDGVKSERKSIGEFEINVELPARPEDEKATVPTKIVNFIYVQKNQMSNPL